MMDDIEKTKPVAEAPADDDETGAGCDVCMPPIALVGADEYDYKYLCMPSMPWSKGGVEPPQFLAKDEKLPLTLSLVMGLQHALAMVAGIATSGGMLIAGDACFKWQQDSEMCESREYLVSAAWITSGILTIIQVFRAKIIGTGYYLGTGLISVMGTSFTFLPIAREMVIRAITDANAEGKCDCTPGTDAETGAATCGYPFDCKGYGMEGYGRFLGTAMVAAFLEVVIALMPSKMRQKMFPPVVTGVAVMLIGASLIAAGIKYVGGGVFCAENDLAKSAALPFGPQLCNENGNVMLPFGSPEYVGLAFSADAASSIVSIASRGEASASRHRANLSRRRHLHERLPAILREPLPQVDVSVLGPDVRLLRRRHQHVRGQGLGLGQVRADLLLQ